MEPGGASARLAEADGSGVFSALSSILAEAHGVQDDPEQHAGSVDATLAEFCELNEASDLFLEALASSGEE
eukprot:COSAG01_NODE_47948_length_385_cov_1.444056_1_plen_70_part_01